MDVPKYLLARLNTQSEYPFESRLKYKNNIPIYAKHYFHEFRMMRWKEMTLDPKKCINTIYWTLFLGEGMLYTKLADVDISKINTKCRKQILEMRDSDLPKVIAVCTKSGEYILYDGWHTGVALMLQKKTIEAYVGFAKSFSPSHRYLKDIAQSLQDYAITGDYKRYFEKKSKIRNRTIQILVPDMEIAAKKLKNYTIIKKHERYYIMKHRPIIKLIQKKDFKYYSKDMGDFKVKLEST